MQVLTHFIESGSLQLSQDVKFLAKSFKFSSDITILNLHKIRIKISFLNS